jgi:transposase
MLEGLEPEERVFTCGVRTLMSTLDQNDKQILLAALENHQVWTHKGLERALRQRGLKISEKPLRLHRMGICSCKVGWQDA